MNKILCLIDTLGMGGAERQMIGLAVLLKSKGYYVDLVTYHEHDFHHELVTRYGIGSLTLHTKSNPLSKLCKVLRFVKESGGYDYVIAYKDGPACITSILRALGLPFKLIVSERNTNQSVSRKDKFKFWLYRFADHIVTNSYSQADFINKSFPELSEKTLTITNFTDTDLFQPKVQLKKDKLTIMTVARIASQKNVLSYLKAIQHLKKNNYSEKVHFLWYGDVQTGEEEYGELCKDMVSSLQIEDMIDFYPATTNIATHYTTSDIFCLPSIYEGFPNVVCEAMSSGNPVVCSNVCDNPRIVKEGQNALMFDPNDVVSIYSTLKKMIDMPQVQLKEWGETSRKIAEDSFSMESFVQKYIRLLENE